MVFPCKKKERTVSKSIFHTSFFSAFFIAHLTIQLSLLYFSLRFFCFSSLANFFFHSLLTPLLLYFTFNIVLLYFFPVVFLTSAWLFFFFALSHSRSLSLDKQPSHSVKWKWAREQKSGKHFLKIVARKKYAARNEILNLSLEITSNSVENVKSC